MSALKLQVKELIASLSAEANTNKDPEVKRRFYLIKAVVESSKDVKKTCEMRGVSTDYFYKWVERLLNAGTLLGLVSGSRSAKTFWNQTSKRIEKKIIKLRLLEPFKGPERISFDLKKKFKIVCAPSTVAAVLKRKGLVTKQYQVALTKKHLKRYRRPWPGYLQMDFKYTPFLVEGKKTYQLSVVDHHSSWRFIRSYENREIKTVMDFLNELIKEVPFVIFQIQTDNAVEFTDKYSSHYKGLKPTECHEVDKWCADHGIEHKLIPIGQKEINGKVENTHRFDDREFFSQTRANTCEELQRATIAYNRYWNQERPTKALGWQTPLEVIKLAELRALVFLKITLPETAWLKPEPLATITIGTGTITASKSEIKRIREENKPKKRAKKLTAVDRYLQYLDWEDKQKLKFWIIVPTILQNFSPTWLSKL